jgi:hypothetical protein
MGRVATRSTSLIAGIVDLSRHLGGSARLLDVIDNRGAQRWSVG